MVWPERLRSLQGQHTVFDFSAVEKNIPRGIELMSFFSDQQLDLTVAFQNTLDDVFTGYKLFIH
jgi:hypothetical protein